MTLTFRVAPVLSMTIKQFLGGKAVRVVVALSLIPVVFALIYMLNPDVDRPTVFLGDIFTEVIIPTLMPLTILVLATSAFGDEIEDRTLPYLTLKPVSRFRIVLEKLLGSIVVSGPIVIAGLAIAFVLTFKGDASDHLRFFGAMAATAAVATVAYSAIFMLVSLLISRALVAALIYSFVWETILGRFVPGLRYVSIRHFVRSVFAAISEERRFQFSHSASLTVALLMLGIASAVAIALSTWRLRSMNLE
jgi:ABC-2 type transport system permease protein